MVTLLPVSAPGPLRHGNCLVARSQYCMPACQSYILITLNYAILSSFGDLASARECETIPSESSRVKHLSNSDSHCPQLLTHTPGPGLDRGECLLAVPGEIVRKPAISS
jgi:hypothetical protein